MLLMLHWSRKSNTIWLQLPNISSRSALRSILLFYFKLLSVHAAVNTSPLLPVGSHGRYPAWLRDGGVIYWSCGCIVKHTMSGIKAGISSYNFFTTACKLLLWSQWYTAPTQGSGYLQLVLACLYKYMILLLKPGHIQSNYSVNLDQSQHALLVLCVCVSQSLPRLTVLVWWAWWGNPRRPKQEDLAVERISWMLCRPLVKQISAFHLPHESLDFFLKPVPSFLWYLLHHTAVLTSWGNRLHV